MDTLHTYNESMWSRVSSLKFIVSKIKKKKEWETGSFELQNKYTWTIETLEHHFYLNYYLNEIREFGIYWKEMKKKNDI